MSDEIEERPFFVNLSDAIKDSAFASPPTLGVHVTDEIRLRDSASVSPPLVQMGGVAIYPTTGLSQVIVIRREGSRLPRIEAHLREKIWDMTTIGVGVTVGVPFGGRVGAGIGGIVMYAWGRSCWSYWNRAQKKRASGS